MSRNILRNLTNQRCNMNFQPFVTGAAWWTEVGSHFPLLLSILFHKRSRPCFGRTFIPSSVKMVSPPFGTSCRYTSVVAYRSLNSALFKVQSVCFLYPLTTTMTKTVCTQIYRIILKVIEDLQITARKCSTKTCPLYSL